MRALVLVSVAGLLLNPARAWDRREAVLFVDFADTNQDVKVRNGFDVAKAKSGAPLEFKTPRHEAEIAFSQKLHNAKAASIGGWFFPRRAGRYEATVATVSRTSAVAANVTGQ